MTFEVAFSIAGVVAMAGWLALFVSPWIGPWADRIAGVVVPIALSLGYVVLLLGFPAEQGGFGSLRDVGILFSSPSALLAGWVHFLAFDLFVGAWMCRDRVARQLPFWLVLPCLPVTFLFGPAGYALYVAMRGAVSLRAGAAA